MRKLNKFWRVVVAVISIALVLFHVYTSGFGMYSDLIQRSIHMAGVLALMFILKPVSKKEKPRDTVPVYDIFLACLAVATTIYILIYMDIVVWYPLQWNGFLDKFFAVALVVLVLEASRRSVGLTFTVLAVVFFVYAFCGESFPGVWAHKNFTFNQVFQTLYHTTNGIYGTLVGTSATMLAMFSIFGAVLSETGGAGTFIKIGQKLAGNTVGGPGKVNLIASGLFGMISGSALGNVVATGTLTIPLMKESGYDNEWSGAVSAVGSTGGQIMPPIMGTGAFIMATNIGLPYLNVAKAAIFPAFFYYLGAYIAVHFIAKKLRIRGQKSEEKISVKEYLSIGIPLAVFLYFLIRRYSVTYSAFYSTLIGLAVCIVTIFIENKLADAPKKTVKLLYQSALNGASSIIDIAALLAGAQITISLVSMTGFGVKLSNMIISIGRDHLFYCLLLSMLVCIVLGMGLPTTASYVLSAAILAPALVTLGIRPLTAHMFVFYFACLATITPPVCPAVYLSSGIAQSKWVRTGFLAVLIALPGFIVPYTFAYNPTILLEGAALEIAISILTATVGVWAMGIAVAGFFRDNLFLVWRILLIAGGILLVVPNLIYSLIGLALVVVVLLLSFKIKPKTAAAA